MLRVSALGRLGTVDQQPEDFYKAPDDFVSAPEAPKEFYEAPEDFVSTDKPQDEPIVAPKEMTDDSSSGSSWSTWDFWFGTTKKSVDAVKSLNVTGSPSYQPPVSTGPSMGTILLGGVFVVALIGVGAAVLSKPR